MRILHHQEGINSEGDAKLACEHVGFVVCFDRQVVNVDRDERLDGVALPRPRPPRSLLQHTLTTIMIQ